MSLIAQHVSYQIKRKNILSDCSVAIKPGVFTAVVGPNGAGKTSLLRILSNETTKYKGKVELNGETVSKIKSRQLSQLRAVLPQHTVVSFPFTVEQVIQVGRYPHLTTQQGNEEIICEVMKLTNLIHFKGRVYQTLSGGEQQRVQMARVMAQIWDEADHPKYLLLDEPTSSLDLSQQHALLDLALSLCSRSIGVLAILHDLNLAAQYADEVLFLKEGHTVAQGKVLDVMTKEIIEETYAHPVRVSYDEYTNRPMIYPVAGGHTTKISRTINPYVYEQLNT